MTDRYARFSERNRTRCEAPHGFNHPLEKWSNSDWYTAMMGEFGEAGNVLKKLNRIRDGIPNTNGETLASLQHELAEELADGFTYLDLFCQKNGIDLLDAAERKFLKVSEKRGYVEQYRPFGDGPAG